MVTQLNKTDHEAIRKRRIKHDKTFKKELQASKTSVWSQIFSADFIVSQLAMVISWIGLEYLIKSIISAVSKDPVVVMKILKYGGIYGTIAGIGLIGVIFIIKEFVTIKRLESKFDAGKLKDLEGKTIKTRKGFLEAVIITSTGVKNVKAERFLDHLLKIDKKII